MTVSPLRGRRSPISGAAGAGAGITHDRPLHRIAGYLPPLIEVAALALGRRTSARTS